MFRRFVAVLLLSALTGCGLFSPERAFVAQARLHVKHVVIVVQENRSFDNLFQGFPGADTVDYGYAHDGTKVKLKPIPLNVQFDIGNGMRGFRLSYDHGKMDGFDLRTIGPRPGLKVPLPDLQYPEYAYVPHDETKPYFAMAHQYVLADRMFQSNIDQSFVAHLYLIAGQAAHAVDLPNGYPWGCDARLGTTVGILNNHRRIIDREPPCFKLKTLGSELSAKHDSWRYYAPKIDKPSMWSRYESWIQRHRHPQNAPDFGQNWSSYDAVSNVRYSKLWKRHVVSPPSRFIEDVRAGKLADVSWVIPDWKNSDHSLARSITGPSWVSALVNTIGESKYWKDTVIIVTWDDSGGWYDHVPPPQLDFDGLGFRVPLLVISPYAKHGYVSHVQYEFGSILRFTESIFRLGHLAASDRRANNLRDAFDFSQPPRAFTPIPAPYPIGYFLRQKASGIPPDDN